MKKRYHIEMLNIGRFNNLRVSEVYPLGYILKSLDPSNNLLVSLKQTETTLQVDDIINVFVYTQANGELQASLQQPLAMLDEFAPMTVLGNSQHGSFFNWGIETDLYAPQGQLHTNLDIGCKYVVRVVQDKLGKLVGTTRIERFLSDSNGEYNRNRKVSLLVYAQTPLGYKTIVDNKYSGLLYKNEILTRVKIGDKLSGFVSNVRDDGKLDLSLQAQGNKARSSLNDAIIEDLIAHDGMSTLTDKSPPAEIYAAFKVSKNAYKKAIGNLYKQKRINIKENCLYLIKK